MKRRTTIQVPREVREELKKHKKYRRETYSDVLKRFLKKAKKGEFK